MVCLPATRRPPSPAAPPSLEPLRPVPGSFAYPRSVLRGHAVSFTLRGLTAIDALVSTLAGSIFLLCVEPLNALGGPGESRSIGPLLVALAIGLFLFIVLFRRREILDWGAAPLGVV